MLVHRPVTFAAFDHVTGQSTPSYSGRDRTDKKGDLMGDHSEHYGKVATAFTSSSGSDDADEQTRLIAFTGRRR